MIIISIIYRLSKEFPNLKLKLKQADIEDSPEKFITKTLLVSLYSTLGITLFLFFILSRLGDFEFIIFLFSPVLYFIFVMYFFRIPDVKVLKKEREISKEIVFAGRFLIIELESGVPVYNAFKNISKNYPEIGKHFTSITNKIDLGTQMEDSINEEIEFSPSPNFRKILWQIINAQKTGADISTSLKTVVENISKEHLIEIKEYGRKLNPLAMFYMIIAVILPSIGITMLIVLSTFLNLKLDLTVLLTISFFLVVMQLMFLAIIRSSRPSVEL